MRPPADARPDAPPAVPRLEGLVVALLGVLVEPPSDPDAPESPAALAAMDDVERELAALRAARALERRLDAGLTLRPGAREALAALAGELRVAVVTRAPRAAAERALALAGLDAVVGVVVAGEALRPQPGDPAGWGHGCRAAQARLARVRPGAADPRAVVALVGDSVTAEGARAAGLRTIFVGAAAPGVAVDARVPGLAGLDPARLAALLDLPPAPPGSPA